MPVPREPKIYRIVHVDTLPSMIADSNLWCDAEIARRSPPGTKIGMQAIKDRRLKELKLTSYPDLFVGDCVPFYFCPRSIMLYLLYQANLPELTYRGGQGPIIHLEADLHRTVAWAEQNSARWAFTLSNAGARYFEDRCNLNHLNEINWDAVQTDKWSGNDISSSVKEGKQAEFLIERAFPVDLIEHIGVYSRGIADEVKRSLPASKFNPSVEIKKEWYY